MQSSFHLTHWDANPKGPLSNVQKKCDLSSLSAQRAQQEGISTGESKCVRDHKSRAELQELLLECTECSQKGEERISMAKTDGRNLWFL